MIRYVFDTNVIVSALLFNASKPGLAFLRAVDSGTILTSAGFLTELHRCPFPPEVQPIR